MIASLRLRMSQTEPQDSIESREFAIMTLMSR
jgi:hypothetical protein